MQIEQEMAAEAATNDFVLDGYTERLQDVDAWLQDTERSARARLDSAAAHNRNEVRPHCSMRLH